MTYFPISQNLPNFSSQDDYSEEPTSVDDKYEHEGDYDDEEYYDELLDAEMHYLYEEQGSFNEDALEPIFDAGLILLAEEEWHKGGLNEYATL